MGEGSQIRIKPLWLGRSPLRVAGTLLAGWLICLILLMIYAFPSYPQTRTGWFWFLFAGPPALLASAFVFEGIGSGISKADPELRPWKTLIVLIGLVALVAWGIHSVP